MLTIRRVIGIIVFWVALLTVYALVVRHLETYGFYREAIALANDPATQHLALVIFYLAMTLALMTPFSSAALFLLAALEVLGPYKTFAVAYLGGATATILSYWIGYKMSGFVERSRLGARLHDAQAYLRDHPRGLWTGLFLARAVPTPLYDVFGYAAGVMRIPFWTYLIPSSLGGIIPLAVMCFVPELFSD